MDAERLNQEAAKFEKIVKKQFERLGYEVKRLDKQGHKRRPDFLISDSSGPQLVCEVKAIFSAGYLVGRGAHISTLDSKLLNTGQFVCEIDFSRMDDALSDSADQYRQLSADCPELSSLPFVVAFFFDDFADHFDFYPQKMEHFPEVSGILKIEKDRAIENVAKKMTKEALKKRIQSGSMRGLPASSKDFLLVKNQCARNELPRSFTNFCIVAGK